MDQQQQSTTKSTKTTTTKTTKTSKLTCGAKALAKHCHRCESENWWLGKDGKILSGNEAEKNRKAEKVLERILKDVSFVNAHILPHQIPCFEIRTKEGYGARWVYKRGNKSILKKKDRDNEDDEWLEWQDSNEMIFRGFLEPYQENGHDQGWRH